MKFNLCAPCLFGLEGPLGNELRKMGMENVAPENGRVRFVSDENGLVRANIKSRFAERILVEVGHFKATSFDELFEGVKALDWATYMPSNAEFPVKGHSLDSALFSIPDCQKIIKKATAEKMKISYKMNAMCPEDGALYQIQFSIMKDMAYIYIDSSGLGLHKRGYRLEQVTAPLRETLAAAMVDIAGYRGRGDFCDPFCGSGTIAIEAAYAAKNRAPGINRRFSCEKWAIIPKKAWLEERTKAREAEFNGDYKIFASDIDPHAVNVAKENAKRAGVADLIEFSVADARYFNRVTERGIIVTNPPYGERLLEKREAEKLYRDFGKAWLPRQKWNLYILSSHTEFEHAFGKQAIKKRKLYNGMIKCDMFMYY